MLPTTPVKLHVWPALFVQVAVADEPTVKHVTEASTTATGTATSSSARIWGANDVQVMVVVWCD